MDVRTANALDVFVDEFACESSHDHIGGESYVAERRTHDKARVAATLTEQAQNPRQDTLRRQLDDLTRVWPVVQGGHGEKQRKKQLLCDQNFKEVFWKGIK